MISNFPQLIKCLRNEIMEVLRFQTPDGIAKKQHWVALLRCKNAYKSNLRLAHKLARQHLNPMEYQKMNVLLTCQATVRSYSLIKPSRKSRRHRITSVMRTRESLAVTKKPRVEWLQSIDNLLNGVRSEEGPIDDSQPDHDDEASASNHFSSNHSGSQDHYSYDVTHTSKEVQAYITSLVRWRNCVNTTTVAVRWTHTTERCLVQTY